MKLRYLTPIVAIGLCTLPGKAYGHMVETNVALERLTQGGTVLQTQTTFSNGDPLKGAKVSVYAPTNPVTPWARGTTDGQGQFRFSPDPTMAGDWEVIIRQQGHGDVLTVPVRSQGVRLEEISDSGGSDNHYASGSGLALLGLGAVLLGRRWLT